MFCIYRLLACMWSYKLCQIRRLKVSFPAGVASLCFCSLVSSHVDCQVNIKWESSPVFLQSQQLFSCLGCNRISHMALKFLTSELDEYGFSPVWILGYLCDDDSYTMRYLLCLLKNTEISAVKKLLFLPPQVLWSKLQNIFKVRDVKWIIMQNGFCQRYSKHNYRNRVRSNMKHFFSSTLATNNTFPNGVLWSISTICSTRQKKTWLSLFIT